MKLTIIVLAFAALSLRTVEGAMPQGKTVALMELLPATDIVTDQDLPTLRGSKRTQELANKRADREAVLPVKSYQDIKVLVAKRELVPLAGDDLTLRIDRRLKQDWRFCRPWTEAFLRDLSQLHFKYFERPLQVNSGVRTIAYQLKLWKKGNLNAAGVEGPYASLHLRGMTIDITKIGMSPPELQFLRDYFIWLEEQGQIDATEEFEQAVFHLVVFQAYEAEPDSGPVE